MDVHLFLLSRTDSSYHPGKNYRESSAVSVRFTDKENTNYKVEKNCKLIMPKVAALNQSRQLEGSTYAHMALHTCFSGSKKACLFTYYAACPFQTTSSLHVGTRALDMLVTQNKLNYFYETQKESQFNDLICFTCLTVSKFMRCADHCILYFSH